MKNWFLECSGAHSYGHRALLIDIWMNMDTLIQPVLNYFRPFSIISFLFDILSHLTSFCWLSLTFKSFLLFIKALLLHSYRHHNGFIIFMTRLKFKRKVGKNSSRFERIDGDNEERRPFSLSKKSPMKKRRIDGSALVWYIRTETEGRPHTLLNRFLLNNRQCTRFTSKKWKKTEKKTKQWNNTHVSMSSSNQSMTWIIFAHAMPRRVVY